MAQGGHGSGSAVRVLTNLGEAPVDLPDGFEVLATSRNLVGGQLPTNTTVWLRD